MANWFKPPPPRPGSLADVLANRGTSALPGSLARNLFRIDPRIVANLLKAFLRQIEKPTSPAVDRKSTRLNSSHRSLSRMPSSA